MRYTFKAIFAILLGILPSYPQSRASEEIIKYNQENDADMDDKTYKILCIDDSPIQNFLYSRFWDQFSNVTYVKATSANDGYEKLSEDNYDAVLLDYSMPENTGGTGYDLLSRIKENSLSLPKEQIFIASSSEESRNLELLRGFPEYICSVFPKSGYNLNEETLENPLMLAGIPKLIKKPSYSRKKQSVRKAKKKRPRSGDSTMADDGETFVPVLSPRNFE